MGDPWADPTGGEFCIPDANIIFVRKDIIETSC